MKRHLRFLFVLLLLAITVVASAQVTIKVEDLSKPEKLLPVWKVEPNGNTLSVNVDADSLVLYYGMHPFFYGMYDAYAEHRPFVLSPDMVWMLISQGFSHHINANPEKYRDRMVDFQGKLSLAVESDKPLEEARWDELIPQFAEEIKKNTKGTIAETIIADFSTTTSYEQIASEITLMETTKAYFDFVVIYAACGIPEITLLGTTEDWQKVYDKTMQLRSFDLAWWVDELKPILKQFVKASEGDVDTKFWRNMFKWHTQKEYGAPNIIDGWIVKFFPYDKYGKRFDLKTLTRDSSLPDEMAEADVRFVEIFPDGSSAETMIELYGGFVGLEQNPENYALTPKIGWKVVKNDDTPMVERMKKNTEFGLILKVKEVPEILRKMDSIPSLTLYFRDGVRFPEWMKDVKIDHLNVFGEITKEEQKKLLERCPSSTIRVNNVIYDRRGKKINVHCIDNEIGSALDGVDSIGTLKIDNSKRVYYNRIAEYKPDEWVKVTNVKLPADVTKNIDTLILENKLPRMQMKQLKKQLPNTVILYHYEVSFGEQYMAQGPQSTFSLLKNKYSRQKPKDISVDTEKLMENLPPRQPMPQLQEEKR
ncbi:MAG: DUF4419 domain-containing protein [Bacteroidales bacterium]|jgi:hypothetical protein|nr:DUF4419 domain-containing protein [Bacteroidales bacterium]